MKITAGVLAFFLLTCAPAPAHRLDEYLLGTLIAAEKDRIEAQMTLTPGVLVYPAVLAAMDRDRDGTISNTEQRAYAERVLRDLSLTIDGRRLTPRLTSLSFPAIEDMQAGRGEIRLEFRADLPPGGPSRRLVLEDHHLERIAAYQVNCLVPSDPDIRIVAQNRNWSQSLYQLEYTQAGVRSGAMSAAWRYGDRVWLGAVAFLLIGRFTLLWQRRTRMDRAPCAGSAA
ncbi:MAG TPA: hypothetical protein VMH81_22485 [Bryobacteraceae bacterium]|nr:hypothetical protein [Bryobacteraceae bacterium]